MSARAAWRLESLGFSQVFRYTAGKYDWFAAGLPMEGTMAGLPRAGDVARRNVLTCRLTDRIGDVRERLPAGEQVCIVVNEALVVMGRLRRAALAADPQTAAESVMESGPTTIRPNTLLSDIARRMHQRNVSSILVSDSDGVLIGILDRADADRHLAEAGVAGGHVRRVRAG
jgi:CBS domain-containing protein